MQAGERFRLYGQTKHTYWLKRTKQENIFTIFSEKSVAISYLPMYIGELHVSYKQMAIKLELSGIEFKSWPIHVEDVTFV